MEEKRIVEEMEADFERHRTFMKKLRKDRREKPIKHFITLIILFIVSLSIFFIGVFLL